MALAPAPRSALRGQHGLDSGGPGQWLSAWGLECGCMRPTCKRCQGGMCGHHMEAGSGPRAESTGGPGISAGGLHHGGVTSGLLLLAWERPPASRSTLFAGVAALELSLSPGQVARTSPELQWGQGQFAWYAELSTQLVPASLCDH